MSLAYLLFTFLFLPLSHNLIAHSTSRFLIVINPAGDQKNPGRKLSDSFERGATIQCAKALKTEIETTYKSEVVLTRTAGTSTTLAKNIQLANRLDTDLFIHISFFHETQVKPRLFIYTFSYGNDFPLEKNCFMLCPQDQAHCYSLKTTHTWAQLFYKTIIDSLYDVQPIIKAPYKPLTGITAPALGIEIGLHATRDWKKCIQPITRALGLLIKNNLS